MPNLITQQFNRTIIQRVSTVDLLSSVNAVDIKADPSQQIRIYGVDFGYIFLDNLDRLAFQQSYCVGYLDFTRDLRTFSFASAAIPEIQLGEIFWFSSLSNELNTFKNIDISNPLIINGDRRVTFIIAPPELSGAPVAEIIFILEVRGEVTQIGEQDKPRLGNWTLR